MRGIQERAFTQRYFHMLLDMLGVWVMILLKKYLMIKTLDQKKQFSSTQMVILLARLVLKIPMIKNLEDILAKKFMRLMHQESY